MAKNDDGEFHLIPRGPGNPLAPPAKASAAATTTAPAAPQPNSSKEAGMRAGAQTPPVGSTFRNGRWYFR